MKHTRISRLLLILLLLACPLILRAENPKSIHPTGYVTDLAGVIAADTKARLEALCYEVEQKAGAQMAIVTVRSLDGEGIENYAVDLYKQLGVGSKSDNRGVLLLVAPDEHKYRVEVGYGLEPVINDARAGDAGRTLSGQPPARPHRKEPDHSSPISLWLILFIIWIIFSIARAGRSAASGRRGGGGGWWIGPMLGGMSGGWRGGGFGGSSGGYSGGGGFGGFGGGSSGGGGASGSW